MDFEIQKKIAVLLVVEKYLQKRVSILDDIEDNVIITQGDVRFTTKIKDGKTTKARKSLEWTIQEYSKNGILNKPQIGHYSSNHLTQNELIKCCNQFVDKANKKMLKDIVLTRGVITEIERLCGRKISW